MAELLSPLTGKILEINYEVGQVMTDDDEIMIIEAMKMENAVYGENGTITEIRVKVGDSVSEEDILAIYE